MKKMKTLALVLGLVLFAFIFYSCSTDEDEALTIEQRIERFFDNYNDEDNNIRYNFSGSLANSDIKAWNLIFNGSASTHKDAIYDITEANEQIKQGSVDVTGITNDGTYLFNMTNSDGNWLITSIMNP